MRENRTYGSEGGAAETNRPFLPLSSELDRATSMRRARYTMTNDEIPNDERMPKSEARTYSCVDSRDVLLAPFRHSSLDIRASFDITHSSFVIHEEL